MAIQKKNLNIKNRSLYLEPLEARQLLSVNVTSQQNLLTDVYGDDVSSVVAQPLTTLEASSPQVDLSNYGELPIALEGSKTVSVSYIDENGDKQSVNATVVTSDMTGDWAAGWYVSTVMSQ